MKILFFGTSEFSVSALEALLKSRHKVVSAVTQPGRQRGRGLKLLPQPVDKFAKGAGLKVLHFKDVNSEESIEALTREGADIFVVVAFGQILSKKVLDIPGLCCLNIHASLLPKYRGAAPIQWALINGEKETGVTIIKMNESLDKGDIAAQDRLTIGRNEDAFSLSKRLSSLGAKLLVQTLDDIEEGAARFTPQDESKVSYAPKLKKEDGLIDWKKDASSIKNLIRGCYPWPSAYTYLDGKLLKILEAEVSEPTKAETAGSIIESTEEGILVSCGEGTLLIKRLQLEGKRPLTAAEFVRGFHLQGRFLSTSGCA